jgi:type IV secretory pathway VirJ component
MLLNPQSVFLGPIPGWRLTLAALLLSTLACAQAMPSNPATVPSSHSSPAASAPPETFSHGYFEHVPIFRPASAPRAVALLLSDRQGWTPRDAELAESLRQQQVLVAGIDLQNMMRAMQADAAECLNPQGDLDNFSRFLQARYQLDGYRLPILIGRGQAGSALVYGVLASAPDQTFSGGVSLDFAPSDISLPMTLCSDLDTIARAHPPTGTSGASQPATGVAPRHGRRHHSEYHYALQAGQRLAAPWLLFAAADQHTDLRAYAAMPGAQLMRLDDSSGPASAERQLSAALARLEPHQQITAAPPAAVSDLPLVEAPAAKGSTLAHGAAPDVLAIMLSGDGGWAGIDKELATAMNRAGLPVVGFDSLRYFWKARSPESTAHDIARLLRYYQAQPSWKRARVLLIGYSQGADVLPFVVNRLPAELRAELAGVVLLGMGERAAFEFHVSNWLKASEQGLPTLPEAQRLPAGLALCIYGTDDEDAICPRLRKSASPVRVLALKGDHHFDGHYDQLAQLLLGALPPEAQGQRPAAAAQ